MSREREKLAIVRTRIRHTPCGRAACCISPSGFGVVVLMIGKALLSTAGPSAARKGRDNLAKNRLEKWKHTGCFSTSPPDTHAACLLARGPTPKRCGWKSHVLSRFPVTHVEGDTQAALPLFVVLHVIGLHPRCVGRTAGEWQNSQQTDGPTCREVDIRTSMGDL